MSEEGDVEGPADDRTKAFGNHARIAFRCAVNAAVDIRAFIAAVHSGHGVGLRAAEAPPDAANCGYCLSKPAKRGSSAIREMPPAVSEANLTMLDSVGGTITNSSMETPEVRNADSHRLRRDWTVRLPTTSHGLRTRDALTGAAEEVLGTGRKSSVPMSSANPERMMECGAATPWALRVRASAAGEVDGLAANESAARADASQAISADPRLIKSRPSAALRIEHPPNRSTRERNWGNGRIPGGHLQGSSCRIGNGG
jgi:hypothetical protein